MKQLVLFFALCIFTASVAVAGVSQYKIDDAQIDQIMNSSEEVNTAAVDFAVNTAIFGADANTTKVAGEKNAVVAFILAWFLGYLGIHRFYLGTKALTGVGYILTGGGCGIVAFVDWVMLLIGMIDDDISKYVNNPKFFMWID